VSVAEILAAAGAHGAADAPLGALTTYRTAGRAAAFVDVDSRATLARIAPALADGEVDVVVVGNGSNLLVSDEGFNGVALRLSGEFASLEWTDSDGVVLVRAGAALDLPIVARRLADGAVAGFEWAVGVPGTIGGAAVMNAGGHGSDMAACVSAVVAFSLEHATERRWSLPELDYGYRTSALGARDVVLEAVLSLRHGDAESSRAQLREIVRWRREHQPGGANAGSVFANPPGDSAGALIDRAGLKGLRVGGAHVSAKHANFFQLDDGGTASDVAGLIAEVRRRVLESSDVALQCEVRFVGFEEAP
jgi:UDP-N-acetylmuramate dehydrogenase